MPRTSEMIESKYLKKGDVEPPKLATVKAIGQYNVAMQGDSPEMKWGMSFQELERPLILNTTNLRIMESITGSDDTDDWIGKKIVLYNDPNVSFGGNLTGGIRIRAPKIKPAPAQVQTPPPPTEDETSDGVPF